MKEDLCSQLQMHLTSLRRYAIALVGDVNEADDLVQDTLLNVLTALRKGYQIDHLRGYLFKTLHNLRYSRVRSRRHASSFCSIDEVACSLAVDANQTDHVELSGLIEKIAKLPEEQRQVVLLVCLEGMSYRDTAAVTGLPIGTVMSRLCRARRRLMADLETRPAPNTKDPVMLEQAG